MIKRYRSFTLPNNSVWKTKLFRRKLAKFSETYVKLYFSPQMFVVVNNVNCVPGGTGDVAAAINCLFVAEKEFSLA